MQEVLNHIREDEVVKLACDLVDVPSPTGRERAVGEFCRDWLEAHGVEARLQDLGESGSTSSGPFRAAATACRSSSTVTSTPTTPGARTISST